MGDGSWGETAWKIPRQKGPNVKITYHGGAKGPKGKGGGRKPPKKGSGSGGSTGAMIAIMLVGVPMLTMLGLIGYLLHGYGVL